VLHKAFNKIFNARFFKIKKTLSKIKTLKNVKNVARIKNVKNVFYIYAYHITSGGGMRLLELFFNKVYRKGLSTHLTPT